jgi:hypothetical protein
MNDGNVILFDTPLINASIQDIQLIFIPIILDDNGKDDGISNHTCKTEVGTHDAHQPYGGTNLL